MHGFLMKTLSLFSALFVAPFVLAVAADPSAPAKPKRDPAQLFKAVDKDADGSISLDEFKASTVGQIDPSRVGDVFKKKDADGDGKLTLSEYMFIPHKETPKPAAAPETGAKKKEKKASDQ
jgi:hypothetical protein